MGYLFSALCTYYPSLQIKVNMKTQDLIQIEEHYGAHNYHPLDVVIDKAEGLPLHNHNIRCYVHTMLISKPGRVNG